MARRLRLPLMLLLATLTVVLLLTPAPASAVVSGPTCYGQAGHYTDFAWIDGLPSATCMGANPPYCHVGRQWFEWDCVSNDGGASYHPANIVTYSPSFCYCAAPYYRKCC